MPKLTDKTVKALRPPARGYALRWDSDVHGFGVRVTAGGSKSFILNYRTHANRIRRLTIAEYPAYSTEVAREVAKKHRHTIDNGGDPLADRKAVREAPTFKDLADAYVEEHLPKKRASSAKTDEDALTKVLLPVLGNLKVADITTMTSTAFTAGSPNAASLIGPTASSRS